MKWEGRLSDVNNHDHEPQNNPNLGHILTNQPMIKVCIVGVGEANVDMIPEEKSPKAEENSK